MLILSNAFSLQMLSSFPANVHVVEISQQQAYDEIAVAQADNNFLNAVGHADTMNVLNNLFDTKLTTNRINVSLQKNDSLLVAQLVGGRLPEGVTKLPEGFKFKFILCEFIE